MSDNLDEKKDKLQQQLQKNISSVLIFMFPSTN